MPARGARMTAADLAVGVLVAVVVGWVFVESARWPAPEYVGGPALIPRLVAVAALVAAAALVVQAVRGHSDVVDALAWSDVRRIAVVLGLCVLYVVALDRLGFVVSTGAFLLAFSLVLGERRWGRLIGYAVVMPLTFDAVFGRILRVPLPDGWLF